jgi:hypothetical protein
LQPGEIGLFEETLNKQTPHQHLVIQLNYAEKSAANNTADYENDENFRAQQSDNGGSTAA